MKRKYIMVISILFAAFFVLLILFKYKNNLEMKRYKQIKEDVAYETEKFLNSSLPPEYNDGREEYLYEDDITHPQARGADKSILLDVNKKTYCKAAIYGKCVNNKWNIKVYISCKDYTDKEYEDVRKKVNHHYN